MEERRGAGAEQGTRDGGGPSGPRIAPRAGDAPRAAPRTHTSATAARALPWRTLAIWGSPLIIAAGIALGWTSTSVPTLFGPPAGPPDTLRETRIVLPKTPQLLETTYLKRALTGGTPEQALISALRTRYNVTDPMARMIVEIAQQEGVDPELGFRLIRVESVFDPKAVGSGGALGLTQLMPSTARDIDPTVRNNSEILEPRRNMHLGFRNLHNMIELFDGDVRLGVIAYNRGEVAVQRAVRRGRDPENGYGRRVLGPAAHGGRAYSGKGVVPLKPAAGSAAPSQPTPP